MRTMPMRTTRRRFQQQPLPGLPSTPLGRPVLRVKSRRILLVEDDRDLWPIIERVTRQLDDEAILECLPDAWSAVERMSGSESYDVVLADFLLEGTRSGYWLQSFCEALQPRASFLMMSSMPICSPNLATECFLRKPFTFSECRDFLEGVLLPAAAGRGLAGR